MLRSIFFLPAWGLAVGCLAAEYPAPVVDNATVYDSNGDGFFESVSSTSRITAHWRNVNYLDQRWTKRGIIEVDLGVFPPGSRLESAELAFYLTGTSNTPDIEFWGYPGDGIAELADAQLGQVKMDQQVFDATGNWRVDLSKYARTLIQNGHRYLGINVRAASEGRTNNTFDDEIVFNGYQSTSQVFPGVSASLSDQVEPPLTPVDTLYQHEFDWSALEDAAGIQVSSTSSSGRNAVILDQLRMDQSAPFSIDNRNQLDWTVDLQATQAVLLSFDHQEFGDELHEMPESFTDAVDADGVAVSRDGITWYRLVSASDLDVGARGASFLIDLDTEIDRIRNLFDPAFDYGPDFRIRFQQFDNASAPDDGRQWASLRLTGTAPDAMVDLGVSVTAPTTVEAGTAFPITISYQNTGSDPAIGARMEWTIPTGVFLTESTPGCSQRGNQLTCFLGTVPVAGRGVIDLSVFALADDSLAVNLEVLNQQTEMNPTDNVATQFITVNPALPAPPSVTMTVSPTTPVNEGQALVAEIVDVSDPNFGDTITLDWNLGDGSPAPGNVVAIEHSYADNGTYILSVTAIDSTGLTDTDGRVVEVLNVAPTVDAGADKTVDVLSPALFSGGFADPGPVDTHTVQWQFGDGTQATTLGAEHTFTSPGTYLASLTVTDDDGGQGSDSLQVSVLPVQLLDVSPEDELQFTLQQNGPIQSCGSYQFTNTSSITVDYTIASDVPWLEIFPTQGNLLPGLGDIVEICPAVSASSLAPGSYSGAMIWTEGPWGVSYDRPLMLTVTAAPGAFPLTFDFLPGLTEEGWELYSSDTRGRIQVVDGTLRMDASSSGSSVLNEATITANLANAVDLSLAFYQADFGDEANAMPESFSGRVNADGVAISVDGAVWYRLVEPATLEVTSSGANYSIDLDAAADRIRSDFDPGFAYTPLTQIRFQQYDNYPHPTDGRAWSNIEIAGTRVEPADVTVEPEEPQILRISGENPGTECVSYSLFNRTSPPRAWSVSADQPWITLDTDSGVLDPESIAEIEACWNTADIVSLLPATAILTFTAEDDVFERILEFEDADATVDFGEDFSAGMPSSSEGWTFFSSDVSRGRIDVINGQLRMDVTPSGAFNLNEAILTMNLAGLSGVTLSFGQAESYDERHTLPGQFNDHANGDGVAISVDGNTWYTLLNAAELDVGSALQPFTVDLDAEVARIRANFNDNFELGETTRLKFQQYDNYPQSSDGRMWDNISISNQ